MNGNNDAWGFYQLMRDNGMSYWTIQKFKTEELGGDTTDGVLDRLND